MENTAKKLFRRVRLFIPRFLLVKLPDFKRTIDVHLDLWLLQGTAEKRARLRKSNESAHAAPTTQYVRL